jgi:hypothetical protein
MGCISAEKREAEKKRAQDAYDARVALLKEAGTTDKDLNKDPVLRQLKAEVRKSNRRINAIAAHAAHEAKVKADKAAAPKEKKIQGAAKGKQDDKKAKPKAAKPAKKG